ncbi:hypothetical protein Hdeb2414_s0238g00843991 [Helianthus debilis subsp. tardiflorus]
MYNVLVDVIVPLWCSILLYFNKIMLAVKKKEDMKTPGYREMVISVFLSGSHIRMCLGILSTPNFVLFSLFICSYSLFYVPLLDLGFQLIHKICEFVSR